MDVRTLEALLKARGLSRAELARRVGVTRQAVSLWFRGERAEPRGRHLVRVAEVLGVPVETVTRPLPCLGAAEHARLRATLLWDALYPDLDDFAIALRAREPRALARLVEVHGLYGAEKAIGPDAWSRFPDYERFLHTGRRGELRTLWDWHEHRRAA